MIFFKEAVKLQKEYQKLIDNKQLTKKAMCDLCIPFRDKYNLTDLQTLRIARKEMDLSEMVDINNTYFSEDVKCTECIFSEECSKQIYFIDSGYDTITSCSNGIRRNKL